MGAKDYLLKWLGQGLLIGLYACVVAIGLLEAYDKEATAVFAMPVARRVIVLDAGHGAWDPGMVANDVMESPINLAIAAQLQRYLELGGATVLMTRVDDEVLADTKREDMRARQVLADGAQADILVSIHQNSYPQASVRGAQAFYHGRSAEGKRLAESIQTELVTYLDPDNRRMAKEDESYFLLKETTLPSIIVECGFLSNDEERRLLSRAEYQERVAWAVYMGIVQYFAGENAAY